MRYFSRVVLKILSKTALASVSTARTLLNFSMHFGVVLTRHPWINIFDTRCGQISPHKCITNNKINSLLHQTQSSWITFDCSQYAFIQQNVSPDTGKFCFKFIVEKVSMWTKKMSQGHNDTVHPISNTYNHFSSAYVNIIM